jgi:hypothetical protein
MRCRANAQLGAPQLEAGGRRTVSLAVEVGLGGEPALRIRDSLAGTVLLPPKLWPSLREFVAAAKDAAARRPWETLGPAAAAAVYHQPRWCRTSPSGVGRSAGPAVGFGRFAPPPIHFQPGCIYF